MSEIESSSLTQNFAQDSVLEGMELVLRLRGENTKKTASPELLNFLGHVVSLQDSVDPHCSKEPTIIPKHIDPVQLRKEPLTLFGYEREVGCGGPEIRTLGQKILEKIGGLEGIASDIQDLKETLLDSSFFWSALQKTFSQD